MSHAIVSTCRVGLLGATFLFTSAANCPAVEPTTPLASYGRQAWGMENGLPQNTIQSLAQTPDGFMWLGTEVGLVRFDGNGFQVFDRNSSPALPGNDIRCLLTAKDGALWIGTSDGLARWKDGTDTSFSSKDGLPGERILALAEAADGGIWAYTDAGLARLNGGQFKQKSFWVPGSRITTASREGKVSAWIDPGLTSVNDWNQPGPVTGLAVSGFEFLAQLSKTSTAVSVKNTVWIKAQGNAEIRLSIGKELPGTRIQALLADREGALWIGTNSGLARWYGGKLQLLPVTDPLAKASVLTLMEDREGDLWAGTEADGLHILRDQRFRTFGTREGLTSDNTTTVVEGANGKLWVGTAGGGLNAIPRNGPDPGAAGAYSVRDVLLSDVILSLAASPNGDLWVGTPDGLNHIRGSAVDSFTSADGLPDDFIRSLLVDADGSLWIGTRHGLTHWIGPGASPFHATGTMHTITHADGLGSDLVGDMTRDAHGNLWVATFAGLSRLQGGRIENFTTGNGLSSNVITALVARHDGTLLIGTQDRGWDLWDGKSFTPANGSGSGLDQIAVHAMIDDGLGHLWLASARGIARCDWNSATGGTGCPNWIAFSPADGLRSRETATNSHPSAWRTHDGHLWFATPKGLVEIDAAHFPVNTVPPGVALERFTIDDLPQPLHGAHSAMRIQAGHVHFEFDYAGLSFVAPQKVRYRYMLEGFDHNWTDAGTRRTAYYTNIPAGHYTFRVQAANNDGEWNMEGAALAFELRPHFYQTLWFYGLLIVVIIGLVILVQRLRLKRAEREFNAVLGERNRIAREIHDTLAQGYVGISVQLEVLAELLRMSKVDAAQKHLDLTRGFVREGLADARQSIWALRSQDSGENTLPVKLRRMVETEGQHGANPNLAARFSIFGAYRPLPPATEQEILRIAQEAIHNVKKHADAQNLTVQLEYGRSEINLEVRDDGRGFQAGEVPGSGHYGLTGMRERAAAVNGTLELTSEAGIGTSVRLRVTAKRDAREQREAKE